MESPYPPQLPLPSAAPSSSSTLSSSTTGLNPPSTSVAQTATSSEPRQSRKRALTENDGQEGVEEAREEADNEEEGAEQARAARPRGFDGAHLSSRRGELSRRAAKRAQASPERAWMARSASEGSEAAINAGGPSGEMGSPSKRRRTECVEEGVLESATSSAATRRIPSPPRPSPLQLVPSYQTALASSSPSPLPLSSFQGSTEASTSRAPSTPSASQPPCASPLVPPPSAATCAIPFAFPPSTVTPSTSSAFSAPPRARTRRRANSLPTFSSREHSAAYPYFHPSLATRGSPYPLPVSQAQQSRKHKLYDSRSRLRRGGTPAHFFPSSPISPPELLAIHAVRLGGVQGYSPLNLSPVALAPPITKATLRELDMTEVMRNPQLRHDVVFDPNLQFRANFDGERGERKRLAAEQYWTAVHREISTGCRCTTFHENVLLPCVCISASTSTRPSLFPSPIAARLPSRILPLLVELRNVLLTLLPAATGPLSPTMPSSATFSSDSQPPSPCPPSPATFSAHSAARDLILDVLDPAFIAQQLERGVLDVPALAAFLGRTLKTHCAPMRDVLVDEMVRVCEGEGVATGLRQCFEILELMKLDIANHQLRSLRSYLVQTSVEFERRFLQDFVARRGGRASVERLREWLSSTSAAVEANGTPRTGVDVDNAVVNGLLNLVLPPPSVLPSTVSPASSPVPAANTLPDTLQLDSYRLQAFHADATDLTVLYVLVAGLFPCLAYPARPSPTDVDSLRKELWCIMLASTGSVSTLHGPPATVAGIPQGPPGQGAGKLLSDSWRAGMQDVLLQVAARATDLKNRHLAGTTASSSSSTQVPPMPDAKTLELVASYFETNVSPSSKLFQLLQSRLRSTLQAIVAEELEQEKAKGPSSFASWWAPSLEPATMTTGCGYPSGSSSGARPERSMMASSAPTKRGVKRSVDESDDGELSGSEDESEKRQRTGRSSSISTRTGLPLPSPTSDALPSAVDLALSRNGLTAFSAEVRLLGSRIAKVASFNLEVYRPFYQALLSSPSPSPQ
ncbi:hypothetical protein JCM8547_003931 [Rhodosporidiobolus lusitaniae]